MKFKYFNLTAIKENYRQQIDQFIIDYMFLFPFDPMNSDMTIKVKFERVVLITVDMVCTSVNEWSYDDLTVDELEEMIEQIFEPALLKYELTEKGKEN